MKHLVFATILFASACAVDTGETTDDLDQQGDHGSPEPQDASVTHTKDAKPGGAGGSPLLVYHGGPIAASGFVVEPIFWGPSWGNSSFTGDKISGLQSFYGGMSGTNYDKTNSEYTQTGGAHVGTGMTLGATHVDLTNSARSGNRTGPILSEVCKMISNPRPDGFYPVYIDHPRGHAGYCAWHSAGTCNGVTVQFAFFFTLDGDPGCDPGAAGGHSQGLSALANVSGHETSEALTDPHLDAWYDASGAENSDKCAWTFGSNLLSFGNGTSWRIQGNWSNNAFNAGTGYGGNIGCIDGTN
jgi:hypothetical protein